MVDAISDYATQVYAVADAELRKLRHDPTELLSRAIQPALWLILFGQVMARVRGLSSGPNRYLDFLAPGILAQSVLFVAIFYGISSIWERDLGIVHRIWSARRRARRWCWAKRSPRERAACRRR